MLRHHEMQKTADIPNNIIRLIEKRDALKRYSGSVFCKAKHRKDINRGLNEIWVKEWKIKFQSKFERSNFFLYWLKGPFYNPRCLIIPAFYGFLLYRLYSLIRK
jgi:hypothetical protein